MKEDTLRFIEKPFTIRVLYSTIKIDTIVIIYIVSRTRSCIFTIVLHSRSILIIQRYQPKKNPNKILRKN